LAPHLAALINATPVLLGDDLLPPPADIALVVSAYCRTRADLGSGVPS
jgi:hypothetical protein